MDQLLPLRKGWKWGPRDYDLSASPQAIAPGATFDLVPIMTVQGWLVGAFVWLDNKYAHLVVQYDDLIADASPYALYQVGQTQPQNIGPWLARYDTISIPNIFTMLLTPSYALPFMKEFRAFIRNPVLKSDGTANATARLYAYTVTTLEVIDSHAYIKSIKDLGL